MARGANTYEGGSIVCYPYDLTLTATTATGGTAEGGTVTLQPTTGGGGGGTGVVALWSFEGNLNDSANSHTLTKQGTISYVTGVTGQAIQFAGDFDGTTSEANRVETASTDFAFGNNNWKISFYVSLPSVTGGLKLLVARTDWFNGTYEWYIVYAPGIGFRLRFFNSSQAQIGAADFSITAATNTWYQIQAQYTASTQEASIDVNASGTPATGTLSAAPFTLTGTTVTLVLGGDDNYVVANGTKFDEVKVETF